jgi:hypothetical protein
VRARRNAFSASSNRPRRANARPAPSNAAAEIGVVIGHGPEFHQSILGQSPLKKQDAAFLSNPCAPRVEPQRFLVLRHRNCQIPPGHGAICEMLVFIGRQRQGYRQGLLFRPRRLSRSADPVGGRVMVAPQRRCLPRAPAQGARQSHGEIPSRMTTTIHHDRYRRWAHRLNRVR